LPKLKYEAQKYLRKANKKKYIKDEKLVTIKKRVENEILRNEKLI